MSTCRCCHPPPDSSMSSSERSFMAGAALMAMSRSLGIITDELCERHRKLLAEVLVELAEQIREAMAARAKEAS